MGLNLSHSPQRKTEAKPAQPIPVPEKPEFALQTVKEKEAILNKLGNNLYRAFQNIRTGKEPDPQIARYEKIYFALRDLHIKSIDLLNEKTSTPDRLIKAERIYQLTSELYRDAIQLFSQTTDERANKASEFINTIQMKTNAIENRACIYWHSNSFRKFLFETFGLFATTTHNKIAALEQACGSLSIK